MDTPRSTSDARRHVFSPELERDIASALVAYAATGGAKAETARAATLANRMCTAAHQLGMSAEQMVIELKLIYSDIPRGTPKMELALQSAYDHFLSGCIQSYFEAGAVPPPLK